MEKYVLVVIEKDVIEEGKEETTVYAFCRNKNEWLYVNENTDKFAYICDNGEVYVPEQVALPIGWRRASSEDSTKIERTVQVFNNV
ncbi:hypothetical protein KC678_03940 [Candidatus Dojkabacteria bacterium]|uniref:Uncharacterized protein n=1 Tax=Candidatus Dojkabacteria bacterium TaxID=2099670 RepID=A0A955L292_9BACT|nr:hypothetical protein [Candidatus Dojkabacteria bacterium]